MIRPNKRRFTIAFFVQSGWLPWGTDLRHGRTDEPCLKHWPDKSGRNWPVCCGHVLTDKEVEAWVADGLLVETQPSEDGRRRMVAGPNLERWLSDAWEGLKPARWVAES